MTIKYQTNRRKAPRFLLFGVVLILTLAFSSPNVHLRDPDVQSIILLFALTVFYAFFEISIIADDVGVYKVDLFIFKRGLRYGEVQEVWYYHRI